MNQQDPNYKNDLSRNMDGESNYDNGKISANPKDWGGDEEEDNEEDDVWGSDYDENTERFD